MEDRYETKSSPRNCRRSHNATVRVPKRGERLEGVLHRVSLIVLRFHSRAFAEGDRVYLPTYIRTKMRIVSRKVDGRKRSRSHSDLSLNKRVNSRIDRVREEFYSDRGSDPPIAFSDVLLPPVSLGLFQHCRFHRRCILRELETVTAPSLVLCCNDSNPGRLCPCAEFLPPEARYPSRPCCREPVLPP